MEIRDYNGTGHWSREGITAQVNRDSRYVMRGFNYLRAGATDSSSEVPNSSEGTRP